MFAPSVETRTHPGTTVLGVDPGLTRCGYAVLRQHQGTLSMQAMGVITTPPEMDLADRLLQVMRDIDALIEETAPTDVAVEQVFFQSNARTAMGVAQASGLVLVSARQRGLPVACYTPSQVKRAVTGSGVADKKAIQTMVARRLHLSVLPSPVDAADAAAVALCHLAAIPLAHAITTSAS
jgi:crossover junction endodeoxyribonuclease RuvC